VEPGEPGEEHVEPHETPTGYREHSLTRPISDECPWQWLAAQDVVNDALERPGLEQFYAADEAHLDEGKEQLSPIWP